MPDGWSPRSCEVILPFVVMCQTRPRLETVTQRGPSGPLAIVLGRANCAGSGSSVMRGLASAGAAVRASAVTAARRRMRGRSRCMRTDSPPPSRCASGIPLSRLGDDRDAVLGEAAHGLELGARLLEADRLADQPPRVDLP